MSLRQCVEDIVALRVDCELPAMYDNIEVWLEQVSSRSDVNSSDLDLASWEMAMTNFFVYTMGAKFPRRCEWETVRPFRTAYVWQFFPQIFANFVLNGLQPIIRGSRSTQTQPEKSTLKLLVQAGSGQEVENFFKDYTATINELLETDTMTSSTYSQAIEELAKLLDSRPFLRLFHPSSSSTRIAQEVALVRAVCVADIYYSYHVLRSVWKSKVDLENLMEEDYACLQGMMNFLDAASAENYKNLQIYPKFMRIRDHLYFALARRRGIVPSSFFVSGIKQLDDGPAGRGGFADVWKGALELQGAQHKMIVALKVLRTFEVSEERRETLHQALYREAIVWKMTDHPNVLKFVGLGHVLNGSIAMISPWMERGNLLSYVRRNKDAHRLKLLSQAAKGLYYLHTVNIIHGDLKCANIMVNDEGNAQLADFGLAAFEIIHALGTGSLSRSAGGTPRWQAPELLMPSMFDGTGKITRESDVYAFGMTGLELFTESVPFSHLSEPVYLVEVVGNGLTPDWPGKVAEERGLTTEIWKFLQACWKHNPSSRKNTEDLLADILELATGFIAEVRFPNRFGREIIGRIRRVCSANEKRGWFDNAWNVEMSMLLDGVAMVVEQEQKWTVTGRLTARTIKTHADNGGRKPMLLDTVRSLRRLNHPNIGRVLGLCDGIAPTWTAILWDIDHSSVPLMAYLREKSDCDRIDIVKNIASGLEYLHRSGVVHGDLRTSNIVVEDDTPKIVDYGLPSYFRGKNDAFVRRFFTAPELLDSAETHKESPTPENDVFALGVTFYEVFAERLPLDTISASSSDSATVSLRKDFEPSHPGGVAVRRGMTDAVWTLMCACWSSSASTRPSSESVVRQLTEGRVVSLKPISCF